MTTDQHEKLHTFLAVSGKALYFIGIACLYLIMLFIHIVDYIFSILDHDGGPSTNDDIGAHYDVRSGDFDSVQQYDGIYPNDADQYYDD